MKRKTLFVAALSSALATFGISSAQALSQSRVTALKKAVADIPTIEMAAQAAAIVTDTNISDREEVGIALVRIVVSKRPSLAPAVVGAISKVSPESSSAVAAEAARLSETQASEIVKAAVSAAPTHAEKIASAVAKVAPKSAVAVTRTAVSLVPDSSEKIVESVISTTPSAKQGLQSDGVITRISRVSASSGSGQGQITKRNGTINGLSPSGSPTAVTIVSPGSDPDREDYGKPQ